jgi:hypothetical protein
MYLQSELEDLPRAGRIDRRSVRKRSRDDGFDQPASGAACLGQRAPLDRAESVRPREVAIGRAKDPYRKGGHTGPERDGELSAFPGDGETARRFSRRVIGHLRSIRGACRRIGAPGGFWARNSA